MIYGLLREFDCIFRSARISEDFCFSNFECFSLGDIPAEFQHFFNAIIRIAPGFQRAADWDPTCLASLLVLLFFQIAPGFFS